MVGYFPRHSIAWKIEEPAALRALTLSVIESALLTGIVLHLIRALALAAIPEGRWVLFAILDVVRLLALFAAAAAHLANYPLRHWWWRAPAFAVIAAIGSMATSAALIAVNRERLGSARASWHDWPSMAATMLELNLIFIVLFALVLAGVVYLVRSTLLRREQREAAVSSSHVRRAG
jgi:hypothetical protein